MSKYKYVKKILDFYGKGKHKYLYKGKSVTRSSAQRVERVLRRKSKSMIGSYLYNKKVPKPGDKVYFLHGFDQKVKKGIVQRVDQIYYGNEFTVHIKSGNKIVRDTTSTVFDHKPRKVVRRDIYGKVKVWE